MPSLSEKDRANLEAGLDAIRKIEAFVQEVENAEEVWQIIHNHLPIFKSDIQRIVEEAS